MNEDEIRSKIFFWLETQSKINGGVFSRDDLAYGFRIDNKSISLVGPTGIWIPKGFTKPISITTTFNGPYSDGITDEGILEYSYRGNDPNIRDNRLLREAYLTNTPLIYLHSIKPGKYVAVWPIIITNDNPNQLKITAELNSVHNINLEPFNANLQSGEPLEMYGNSNIQGIKKYIVAITKRRLHQTAFRELVLDAYNRQCTLCKLQHVELLDAAHIIADNDSNGHPIIENGLSLCKIHHAAYDSNIIGISPDYKVKVREDILEEIDGPMLKYGLQSLEGNSIYLPKRKIEYPDKERLDIRFVEFLNAS